MLVTREVYDPINAILLLFDEQLGVTQRLNCAATITFFNEGSTWLVPSAIN
jgi:hypothetical protein